MAGTVHPLAPHHLPFYLPLADGSDQLMVTMTVFIVVGVVLVGTLYLHLHSLPERLAHGNDRMQFEIVAILALVALFTHNNLFWIAALLLAFVRLPDFSTPLASIAGSLELLAARGRGRPLGAGAPVAGEPAAGEMAAPDDAAPGGEADGTQPGAPAGSGVSSAQDRG
jgi:type IV secretory pathway VirB3-like protein